MMNEPSTTQEDKLLLNSKRSNAIMALALAICGVILFVGVVRQSGTNASPVVAELFTPAFSALEIDARHVAIYDTKTDTFLFERDATTTAPLASLTKLMTVAAGLELIGPDALVRISRENLKEEGDSDLREGEVWKLAELARVALVLSSNDASAAIAEASGSALVGEKVPYREKLVAFVLYMNGRAEKYGLTNTLFINPTGLDERADRAGGYGSARDVARLLGMAYKRYPEVLEATRHASRVAQSVSGRTVLLINTNQTVAALAGALGSKTGSTDLAGANLTVLFDVALDHPIAVTVLGSKSGERFQDVEKLVRTTIDYFGSHP